MADDENQLEAGDAADGSDAGKKKAGPLPEFVILLLKIVAAAIGAIVLSVTVSVIVFNLLQGDKPAQAMPDTSGTYAEKPPVLDWFIGIPDIRAVTGDEPSKSVILKLQLGYDGHEDKVLYTEMTARVPQLQDIIRRYISTKTGDELKKEEEVKQDLINRLNAVLIDGRVRDIVFTQYIITDGL